MKGLNRQLDRVIGKESKNNLMYGHYLVLKRHVGAKLPYRIPGEVQHGWDNDCGIHGDLTRHNREQKSATYYLWNDRNVTKAKQKGYHKGIAIGAPFLYLPTAETNDTVSDRKSLLLFPAHASECEPFVDPLASYKRYLQQISELLRLFEPVTVCLYWLQFQKEEIASLFKDRGIRVVTLGHRDNNPYFLYGFHSLVKGYAYISSNHFCSAIFYSLYMRKKCFLFGAPFKTSCFAWRDDIATVQQKFSFIYPELVWENFDDECHSWIGEMELGLRFKRAPDELRELFGWNPSQFVRKVATQAASLVKRKALTVCHSVGRGA